MENTKKVDADVAEFNLAMSLKHGIDSREVPDLTRAIKQLSKEDQDTFKRILDDIFLKEMNTREY